MMETSETAAATPASDVGARFDDDALIGAALAQAVRAAILDHKRTGDPIVVWENGRIEIVPPEQIAIPEPSRE